MFQYVENGASCRIWAVLPGLALHSVTAPNEEVASKFRTTFTRENMPWSHVEFKKILPQFVVIHSKAFGVQNGVHFRVTGKNSGSVSYVSQRGD